MNFMPGKTLYRWCVPCPAFEAAPCMCTITVKNYVGNSHRGEAIYEVQERFAHIDRIAERSYEEITEEHFDSPEEALRQEANTITELVGHGT